MKLIIRFIPLLLVLILSASFISAESPSDVNLDYLVKDYAGVLSQVEFQEISGYLNSFYESNTAQFAVVIVNSLDGQDIDSFALELAQGNLGDSETNNGLLLLISIEDRKYRFEVGRGIEPYLNDAKVGRIGRDIIAPAFKEGNYAGGIKSSILQIGTELGVEVSNSMPPPITGSTNVSSWFNPYWIFVFIFFILPMIQRLFQKKGKGKNGKGKGNDNLFMAALLASSMMRGGGRGGFGGSGGFGGFGGGGFGGGGAGGGW